MKAPTRAAATIERNFRRTILAAVRERIRACGLVRGDAVQIVCAQWKRMAESEECEELARLAQGYGWLPARGGRVREADLVTVGRQQIPRLADRELFALLADLALLPELHVDPLLPMGTAPELHAAAARHGVDVRPLQAVRGARLARRAAKGAR